jgi:CHAD domain-containing protein
MDTPADLAERHLSDILSNLPGAYDGDIESVHRARIATRRLREVMPLIDDPRMAHVTAAVRTAGRQLGRVRELDVMSSLLDSMTDRMPTTMGIEVQTLRHEIRRRQRQSRRTMVKRIERLDLSPLRDALGPPVHRSRVRAWIRPLHARSAWVEPVWAHITDRSADAVDAAKRTPAVYFAGRSHRLRVAVKKLRYAVEVAADTGLWQSDRLLKDLRKIQRVLGDVHDGQVLADLIPELRETGRIVDPFGVALTEMLDSEIARHYAEYIQRRDRIYDIAEACTRAATRRRRPPLLPLVVASALIAPVVLESLRPRSRDAAITVPPAQRAKSVTPRRLARAKEGSH